MLIRILLTLLVLLNMLATGRQSALGLEPASKIFDRIREHVTNVTPPKTEWSDPLISKWLEDVLTQTAVSAGVPEFEIPATIWNGRLVTVDKTGAVSPQQPLPQRRQSRRAPNNRIIVGKDIHETPGEWDIILADGDVKCGGVMQNAVIIARGSVQVESIRNSVVIAGQYIGVFQAMRSEEEKQGNVLISLGWMDVHSADGSVAYAQEGLRVVSADRSVLLGSRHKPLEVAGARSVLAPELSLGPVVNSPFLVNAKLLGIIAGRPKQMATDKLYLGLLPSGVAFQLENRRYVTYLEEPVVDENGRSIPLFEGWKLEFVSHGIAIFRNGDSAAMLRTSD